jgi:hypothetical protein
VLAAVRKPGTLGANLHAAIGKIVQNLKKSTKDGHREHAAKEQAKRPSKPSRQQQLPQLQGAARRVGRDAGNEQRTDGARPPLCILVVYQFQGDTVTGDLFVSTIF